jgi:hypothetical protein
MLMLVVPEADALTVDVKIRTCHCARWTRRSDCTASEKSLL